MKYRFNLSLVWLAMWVLAIAALPSSALAAKGSFQRTKPHVNVQTLFPFAEIPGLGTASVTVGVMLFDTGVARGHIGFVTLEGATLLFRPLLGELVENSEGFELLLVLTLVPEFNPERSERLFAASAQQRNDSPDRLTWQISQMEGGALQLGPFEAPGELRLFDFNNRSP
jgi:hypothetical protein